MPVSQMKDIPYGDPGSLFGGVREHRAILNGLQADAFRSASQSQNTGQAARAFSGSNVTNVQTQDADLTQTATATNTKNVTIGAVTGENANASDFNFNYLQRYIAGADAADLLARGAANIAQDQGGDQSAFAKLNGFEGSDISTASNSLEQDAAVDQEFEVDIDANVDIETDAEDVGNAFNQSRFRTIEANMQDQSAQAIFTSGQRQGSAHAPVSQVAVADGGASANVIDQEADIDQTSNDVRLTGVFNLDRTPEDVLTPRTTELLVKMNELMGTSSAINSSAASQEQGLVQSAAGGVDEQGNVTENGGAASNTGTSDARNGESTTVVNDVSIMI